MRFLSRLLGLFLLLSVANGPPGWAQNPGRSIRVLAAVSPAFKSDPDWQTDIKDRVIFANKIFEPAFGIHFAVERFVPWEPEDETRETDLLIEELSSQYPQEDSLVVVGFHRMSRSFSDNVMIDHDTVGTARYFEGLVVIRDPFAAGLNSQQKAAVLTHEFAHLFGAVHIADPNAIMSSKVSATPSLVLDPNNRTVIQATRDVNFSRGIPSLSAEAIDTLIRVYENLIRSAPHSDFYHQLGRFYEIRKEPAKAVATWEEAIRQHYDNPYIHRELGFYYYQAGRYELAIQELGSAVAHFILPSQKKQRARVLNFLGVAYYQKGNVDQAIFSWLKGLTADSEDAVLQGNLAAAYLQRGDLDRGIEELGKLVAKHPGDVTALSNLGVALMRSGKHDRAVAYFQDALKAIAGRDAQEVRFKEGALGDLMRDISEDDVRLNLGSAYLEMGKVDHAIQEFEKVRDRKDLGYDLKKNLGQAYVMKKMYDRAIQELQSALRIRQDDAQLYSALAQSYAESGRRSQAIETLKSGLLYAKGDLAANFHQNLAGLYLREGRRDRAIEELKVSLNLEWNNTHAHTQLANIYASEGKFQEARRYLQTALRIDPGNAPARELLDQLNAQH